MLKIVTEKQQHIIEYMGATFTVVPNTKEEFQAILKKHTYVHKVKTGPGQKDKYEERTDYVRVQMDNIDSQVIAWTGIADDLECTSPAKRSLASCQENTHICIHIQEEIAKIGLAEEEKKEEEVKN